MLTELDELDSSSGWVPFFQKLSWIARENAGSQKIAKLPENRLLNRYRDVLPYDHSRVVLKDGETDYINANLVEVPSVSRRYILTQGPLKSTSAHFWQMVWEQNSKAIIMLNRVIEKNQIKCSQYWPCGAKIGHTDVLEFGIFRIVYIEENMSEFFTVRTLELFNMEENEKRKILHFHYLHWPDFGVPTSPATFLSFLFEARNAGVLSEDVGPSVIHCSAGIGRSGTYIMVDSILKQVEKTCDLNGVDIKKTLTDVRNYRVGLIQTPDQLRFTYAAILEGTRMLFPDVYEEALDKFLEERDRREKEESEEDETPPPVPARKRHDVDKTVDKEANIAPKRKRSVPDIPSEGPSVAESPKEMPAMTTPDTSKGKHGAKRRKDENISKTRKSKQRVSSYQGFQAQNISSEESDGEDEIIDLSASSSSSSSLSAREPEEDNNIIKGKEKSIHEQENVEYPKGKVEQLVEVKEVDNIKRENREIIEEATLKMEDRNEQQTRPEARVSKTTDETNLQVREKEAETVTLEKERDLATEMTKEQNIRMDETKKTVSEVDKDKSDLKKITDESAQKFNAKDVGKVDVERSELEKRTDIKRQYVDEKAVQTPKMDDDKMEETSNEIEEATKKSQKMELISKESIGIQTCDLDTEEIVVILEKEEHRKMEDKEKPSRKLEDSTEKSKEQELISKGNITMETELDLVKKEVVKASVEEGSSVKQKSDSVREKDVDKSENLSKTERKPTRPLPEVTRTAVIDTEQIVILEKEDHRKMEDKEKPSRKLEDSTEKSKEHELISKGNITMETELDLVKVVKASVEEGSSVKQKSVSVRKKDVDKSENLSKTERKPTRPLPEVTRTAVTGPALALEKMNAIKIKQAIIPEPVPKPMEIESSESAVLESAPGAYARIVNAEKIKHTMGEPSAESIGGSIGRNPRKSDHTVHSKVQHFAGKFTQGKAASDVTQPSTSKESNAELRRRQRQEKKEKTAKLVSDIKAKVKHEENTRWIKKFVKNSLIVIGVCAIAYLAFRCYRYFYPLRRRKFRRFPF